MKIGLTKVGTGNSGSMLRISNIHDTHQHMLLLQGLQNKSFVIGPFLFQHDSVSMHKASTTENWLLFLNGRKSLQVRFSAETLDRFSHQRTLQGKDGRWSRLLQRLHAVSPPAPPEAVHLPLLQVEPRAKQ